MGFKENLKQELIYQDIRVKELADKCGISKRTIDNYLRENESEPTAVNAYRIAKVLGVSVEYLVTGTNSSSKKDTVELEAEQIRLYKKYREIINFAETLPEEKQVIFRRLVENVKELEKF